MRTDWRNVGSESTRLRAETRNDLTLKPLMTWWWNPQLRKVLPLMVHLAILAAQKHSSWSRLMLKALRLVPPKVPQPSQLKKSNSFWRVQLQHQEKAWLVTRPM